MGVHGNLYEIIEPDLYEYIQNNLDHIDISLLQKKILNKAKNSLVPEGFKISEAKENRSFEIDLTVTLDNPIHDHKGNILYQAGYTFNPLDYITLRNQYLFVSDSENHIKFARTLLEKKNNAGDYRKIVIILTDGDPYEAMKNLKRRVYFANASLIDRFRINHVPSLAYQNKGNKQLTVQEFLVDSQ